MCCVAFLVFFFVLHSQQTMRLPQSSSFTLHAKQVSLNVMSLSVWVNVLFQHES